MKRIFLDSNILLDLLLDRFPFADAAENLFATGPTGRAVVLVSSLTFITAHYVVSKRIGKEAAVQALIGLATQVTIATVDAPIVNQALQAGSVDFEDAVQLFAALAAGADVLVTRDPKGFKASSIPVLTPQEALPPCSAL